MAWRYGGRRVADNSLYAVDGRGLVDDWKAAASAGGGVRFGDGPNDAGVRCLDPETVRGRTSWPPPPRLKIVTPKR
jgi:hypothetical protein